MSKTIKVVLTIILVLVVIGGLFYFATKPSVIPDNNKHATGSGKDEDTSVQALAPDTSDAGLDIDIANIDASLSNLATDTTDVNQGLADKPDTMQ